MKRAYVVPLLIVLAVGTGCGSRNTPPPPLDTSMDLNAHEPEKLPYVDPSLPSGNLEKATKVEQDKFIKLQHERMKKQQDEVDDLRRQKFQDGYYKSRYPSEEQ